MSREFRQGVSARLVNQIQARDSVRRVWVARLPLRHNRYRVVMAPTHALPQFRGVGVLGLACAETPAGRDRISAKLPECEPMRWREVSIYRARRIALEIAGETGGVVHLALHDDPHRLVWEPLTGLRA